MAGHRIVWTPVDLDQDTLCHPAADSAVARAEAAHRVNASDALKRLDGINRGRALDVLGNRRTLAKEMAPGKERRSSHEASQPHEFTSCQVVRAVSHVSSTQWYVESDKDHGISHQKDPADDKQRGNTQPRLVVPCPGKYQDRQRDEHSGD